MNQDDSRNPPHDSTSTSSLRSEFGLPELENEQDGPVVDVELLSAFSRDEPLEPDKVELVMNYLTRFQDWREAYIQLVVDHFHQSTPPSTRPTAEPEQP